MPLISEPKQTSYNDTDPDPCVLERLFEEAHSEFDRRLAAKRVIFDRYLETRVNWLRIQLMREAEATDSLGMNHLDFLRIYKPDLVPEASIEYRLTKDEGKSQRARQPPRIPPSSAMRVINTVRRVAARSRLNQATSTPCLSSTKVPPTAAKSTIAARTRSNRMLNSTKAVAAKSKGCTTELRHGRTRRAAATDTSTRLKNSSAATNQSSILRKPPKTSVFDRESVLYALSGSPVANPFAHLSKDVVRKIKKIISEERF
ncbi:unnamed protein product [Hydatigera taeniaeformis]|uniref:Nbl1_Borealin_N domain-containing protein n=1 Tax=Hydatigena taeniaeformis TaxID=6205 RepID=A0A0R3X1U3_HYDTA|nr:unnamed protein product [Hydatigera taeniaeformis]